MGSDELTRRSFLAAGAAVVGCGVSRETVGFALAPWHMWGTTERLTVSSGAVGPANNTVAGSQLARVSYKRPETWSFLFTGRLVSGDVGLSQTTSVFALFDVFIGVGRSVLDTSKVPAGTPANLNAFCKMRWQVPTGTIPGQQNNNKKYATEVSGPPLDDSAATTLQTIRWFPAENISCQAKLVMTGGDPGISVTAEVGAYFAPRAHMRPDWFADDQQFLGMEVKGS